MQTDTENADAGTLEEPEKSSKTNSEVRKTWGFRQSTVAKREMPVEAATETSESRCPVRRSGRQSKRTDKLEEFLLTTKRALRRSAPASLESGDPSSQTPTDAETASETSCDGHPDVKAVGDKAESPERRTRSSTRMLNQRKAQGGRLTRGSSRATVKDEGSSDNEDDCKHAGGTANLQGKIAEKSPGGERCTGSSQSELASAKTRSGEQKNLHDSKDSDAESDKGTDEDSDEDSPDQTAVKMVKRGPIRTYVNKKRAANKSAAPAKVPANRNSLPAKVEPKTVQAAATTRQRRGREDEDYEEDDDDDDDDESDSTSSTSSSSVESDDGSYDPNALYCICRQKHNKRYFVSLLYVYLCKCMLRNILSLINLHLAALVRFY